MLLGWLATLVILWFFSAFVVNASEAELSYERLLLEEPKRAGEEVFDKQLLALSLKNANYSHALLVAERLCLLHHVEHNDYCRNYYWLLSQIVITRSERVERIQQSLVTSIGWQKNPNAAPFGRQLQLVDSQGNVFASATLAEPRSQHFSQITYHLQGQTDRLNYNLQLVNTSYVSYSASNYLSGYLQYVLNDRWYLKSQADIGRFSSAAELSQISLGGGYVERFGRCLFSPELAAVQVNTNLIYLPSKAWSLTAIGSCDLSEHWQLAAKFGFRRYQTEADQVIDLEHSAMFFAIYNLNAWTYQIFASYLQQKDNGYWSSGLFGNRQRSLAQYRLGLELKYHLAKEVSLVYGGYYTRQSSAIKLYELDDMLWLGGVEWRW